MIENEIKHTADLPLGYRVTFTWSKEDGISAGWEPDTPRIKSLRAWRKFRDAYNVARRAFYEDVATCIGGSVLIMDIDGPMEAVLPAVKH